MDLYKKLQNNFFIIAGPCVIEDYDTLSRIAEFLKKETDKRNIKLIFKASYEKANRTSVESYVGPGMEKGLSYLKRIKEKFNLPILTDIHLPEEAESVAQIADILQIPAFLSRQTKLIVAAGQTGKIVNIKKGQFLAPEDMKYAAHKVRQSGNKNVMITDRGTMFGYQDLIIDYRGIPEMQKNNTPVILDITHSLQQPNQTSGVTGGKPELIETVARAGIAVGVNGLFLETHTDLSVAKSDAAKMLDIKYLDKLIYNLLQIDKTVKQLKK